MRGGNFYQFVRTAARTNVTIREKGKKWRGTQWMDSKNS
jgi:hypothetical protein